MKDINVIKLPKLTHTQLNEQYLRILQILDIFLDRLVPKLRISFVNGVDFASWFDSHVSVDKQELTDCLQCNLQTEITKIW